MSCIAGRIDWGSPPGPVEDMQRMLDAMRGRAPDGHRTAQADIAQLGEAFLRTGSSAAEAPSPLTLDGETWLVADARIDDRADLARLLRQQGREVSATAPHGELILHAWAALGDAMFDHLMGDFALALWDGRRRKLVLARDAFGVRPLYYVQEGTTLWFASDVAALFACGAASRVLDDVAVGDFLLVGMCIDPERTIFRNVRCLPPGSRMTVSAEGIDIDKYWRPDWGVEVRYPRADDYVERFAEIFERAVADRVPGAPYGAALSAGMDSSSIAAMARKHSTHPATAYHFSAGVLEPDDDEAGLARETAEVLDMEFMLLDLAQYPLFGRANEPRLRTTLPSPAPHLAALSDIADNMAARGERVHFSGYPADSLFAPSLTYYPELLRGGRWFKFAQESAHHLRHAHSLRGMSLRTILRRADAAPPWKPDVPDWIDRGFRERLHLEDRWEAWWQQFQRSTEVRAQLERPWMHRDFELLEVIARPVVYRYPFLDRRLVAFLAGVPNFARARKWVLRRAMAGLLPAQILSRPKIGAPGDPIQKLAASGKLNSCRPAGPLEGWVDKDAFQRAFERYAGGRGSQSVWTSWQMMQTLSLATWRGQASGD